MCITIKLTLKQAVVGFVLGALALGTYLGHLRIQETSKKLNVVDTVQCELLSQTTTNDTPPKWHNNWIYLYDNETYTFTDETTNKADPHVCCVKKLNAYRTIDCPKNDINMTVFYLICGWLCGTVILLVIWCCSREKKQPTQQIIQLTDPSSGVGASV